MLIKEVAAKQGFSYKRCPICGGNIFIDTDIYGWYEQCLQCGRNFDLPEIIEFSKQENKGEIELANFYES